MLGTGAATVAAADVLGDAEDLAGTSSSSSFEAFLVATAFDAEEDPFPVDDAELLDAVAADPEFDPVNEFTDEVPDAPDDELTVDPADVLDDELPNEEPLDDVENGLEVVEDFFFAQACGIRSMSRMERVNGEPLRIVAAISSTQRVSGTSAQRHVPTRRPPGDRFATCTPTTTST